MKVAMVTSGAEQCGVAAYTQDLAGALRPSVDVELIAFPAPSETSPWFALSRKLNQSADVIHIQYHAQFCGYWRTPFQVYRFHSFLRSLSKPVVVTVHDLFDQRAAGSKHFLKAMVNDRLVDPFLRSTSFGKFLCGGFLKPADRMIVHWESLKNALGERGIDSSKISVLYPGIPAPDPQAVSLPSAVQGWLKGRRMLGMFGFVRPHKGFETLIRALAELPGDIVFLSIGTTAPGDEGYVETLWHLIKSLNLEDRVMFAGYLPNAEVFALLKACHLILLPYESLSQAPSYSLSYAFSAGRPILTSDIPYFSEIAQKFSAIQTFERGNAGQLASKVSGLLKGSPEMEKWAAAFSRDWSWPQVGAKTAEIYREIRQKKDKSSQRGAGT